MADNIPESLLESYRHMIASRYTDQLQADAAQRGEVFFYIPSAGHEASAIFARHLQPSDWLHLHYRDRALAYARGLPIKPSLMVFSRGLPPTPLEDACPPFPASVIFIF